MINKKYNISNKINKTIVLISDLHYSNKKDINRLNSVLDNIRKINPNFICISGDITNKSKIEDEDDLIDWITKLSSITKVVISIGNHEYYLDKKNNVYGLNERLFDKISKVNNLYLLNNKNIILDDINFTGVTLPINFYGEDKTNDKEVIEYIKKIKKSNKNYNVLLIHSPFNICNKEISNDFDLILCGHTHGGAVPKIFRPLFKNNGLISPNKKLFPRNVYGNIKIKNSNIIISSGLKVTPFNLVNKLLKPEVVIINI